MTLLLLLSCAGDGSASLDSEAPTEVQDSGLCQQVDYVPSWNGWAQGFFLTWCTSCHSAEAPDRFGAPEGIDFDTEEQVRALAPAIELVVLEEQSMPKGGGLYEEDQDFLERYLRCGL